MAEKIVCVVGPTACGKTRFGVEIAKKFNGEVVSVDSMQIYRGMTVGTAAATEKEMDGVPHHMIAVADPEESWSVARFTREADRCIQDILARGKLPVLVGGTGLYLDSLVRGNSFAAGDESTPIRKELEARAAKEGIEGILSDLAKVDPVSAAKLHPNDEKRIIRALEVYLHTGKTIHAHNEATRLLPNKYDAIYLGLAFRDREDMKALIDRRVDEMVKEGLLEEVAALVARGLPPTSTALQAIGFKEFLGVYTGEKTEEEAIEEVKLRSRQYAKRQLTWLRKNEAIHWFYWEKERNFALALQNATKILTAAGLS